MNALVNDTSTTSKRSIWPEETRDLWVTGGFESRLCLSNSILYDDWSSALGANTLGYDFFDHLYFRPAASLPWVEERDFADEFCAAMGTEAVRLFKTGSDAVSCAVRLARAFTGRPAIMVFDKSYHGTGDWFGPALWIQGGIDPGAELVVRPFGSDPREWIRSPTGIAAIVVEPVPKAIDLPPGGWLQHLREVCDEHGIIFITDEVILGYRHQLQGYLRKDGVRADLYCYGKAMGQGAAISACTGRRDIMELLAGPVHFSGTNNGEPLPLRIAQATLKEYLNNDICGQLNDKGWQLKKLLAAAGFETRGLDSRFEVVFDSDEEKKDCVKYCFENSLLFPGFCSMTVCHDSGMMSRLVECLKRWRGR